MKEVTAEVVHSLRTPFDLAAEEWPSKQVTAKAVCLKNVKVRGCLNPSRFRGAFVCEAEATVAADISDGSIDFLKRRQNATTHSVGAAFLARFTFNMDLSVESRVTISCSYLQFCHRLFSHVAA